MDMLAKGVKEHLERASWIRKMFEAGAKLKAEFGEDNVYDFSLGNPDLPPPKSVGEGLRKIADGSDKPLAFGYMPNAGYADVRNYVAGQVGREQNLSLEGDDIMMTCGAAGAINSILRAVLEPDDEVICPAPFFVEYVFYALNHGGKIKPVPCLEPDFRLDIEGIASAVTQQTRAVIINSPNNPSGQVYSPEELEQLAGVLREKTAEFGRPIYLISDEPYRFLVYDGVEVPPLLPLYEYSLAVNSFSKSLSLAGERIGYVALCPHMPDKAELLNGLIFANRILGFVNAPAIGQKLLSHALSTQVNIDVYIKRRQAMNKVLTDAGYEFAQPKGGFYFFPKAPSGDDVAFVNTLQEQRILAVPGSGFGFPGYFRLAFCVSSKVINAAAQGFVQAMDRARS